MADWFLDTAFAIALSSPKDRFHAHALVLADQIEGAGIHLITTRAVLLEIGNALSKRRHRLAAVGLLSSIEADPTVEIVPLSDTLYQRALDLYNERTDKEWGLTDCVSFVVMQDRQIVDALTPDEHFQQAGFRALMKGGSPLADS